MIDRKLLYTALYQVGDNLVTAAVLVSTDSDDEARPLVELFEGKVSFERAKEILLPDTVPERLN